MKQAIIVNEKENSVEASLTEDRRVYLAEAEYTEEELEQFNAEKDKWIVRCSGSHQFLADSDSGEDAVGHYRNFFDLVPKKAVFENGRLVGLYLCTDGIDYSGRGRYNYYIDDWGYPGNDPFRFIPRGAFVHVFLFEDADSRNWKDWGLLVRDPEKKYTSYLDF